MSSSVTDELEDKHAHQGSSRMMGDTAISSVTDELEDKHAQQGSSRMMGDTAVKDSVSSVTNLIPDPQHPTTPADTVTKPSVWQKIKQFDVKHHITLLRRFLYNHDTGEIMSRRPKSWLLITIFYGIFYACLAAFWAICFTVFMHTQIDEHVPKWQNSAGIIGSSPSLSFKPYISKYHIPSSTIEIRLDSEDMEDEIGWQNWAKRTDELLNPYRNRTIDLNHLNVCKDTPYGYKDGAPCVYLKLNRIYGIESIPYKQSSLSNQHLPTIIEELITQNNDTGTIWVNCQEKGGPKYLKMIDHFPHGIANDDYIAASNKREMLSPLIAIKLNPTFEVAESLFVQIQCRAWSENIRFDPLNEEEGLLTFELKIRNTTKPPTTSE